MKRKILIYPNQKLDCIAEPIVDEFGSDWLKELVQDMEHTIEDNGVGLAATQIGVNKAVIICKDRTRTVLALCNPEITGSFGEITSHDESCLSVPGMKASVKRFKGIKVKAQTIDGHTVIIKERGFQSIILQHEIDHLRGITLANRASDKEKVMYYLFDRTKYLER